MEIEEFKIKVLPLKNKLYRFAKRLTGNNDVSEDIVQEGFIRLWTKRDDLGRYRSIEALAMTIIKNLCFDWLRLKQVEDIENFVYELEAPGPTPHENLEFRDTIEKVHRIIEMLPEQQKLVIHLRDIEGMEFEEIGSILDMSPETVRVNLSRARNKVRNLLLAKYKYIHNEN